MGDLPSLIYLLLCLALVASGVAGMKLKAGSAAKMALGWGAIFLGTFLLFALLERAA